MTETAFPRGEKEEGLEVARRMAEEEEGMGRTPKGPSRYLVPVIGVFWSLFQLSIASWLILDTVFIRSIHLAFALLIVYLSFPMFKETRLGLRFLSAKRYIPLFDYLLAASSHDSE